MGMGDAGEPGSGGADFFWTLFCFPFFCFLAVGGTIAVDGDAGGCPVAVWS